MLNHKPKEAVAGAFVRRLPTDVNDSTAKSGLGHEHNAHSVGAAYCILANRSANMPVPCRKSVRCGGSSSQQHTRRMTRRVARYCARGVFFWRCPKRPNCARSVSSLRVDAVRGASGLAVS